MTIDNFVTSIQTMFGKYSGTKEKGRPMVATIKSMFGHLDSVTVKKLIDAVAADYKVKSKPPYPADIYEIAENNSISLAKPASRSTLVYYCGECKNQIDEHAGSCTICGKPFNELARVCAKCGFKFEDKSVGGKKVNGKMTSVVKWHVRINCPECTTLNKQGNEKATPRQKYYVMRSK